MDHFTSLASCERDETQARSLTRRGFLGQIAAGTVALGAAAALSSPALAASASPIAVQPPSPARQSGHPPASAPLMTGARYVAMLGGVVRETVYNGYVEKRWNEIAAGPLVEAIDNGALVICPRCLFLNHPRVLCPMCREWALVTPEDVADYVASLRRNYEDLPEMMEEFLTEQRVERAVDLFGGPDSAQFCGQTLYIREMVRSAAA